MSRFLTLATLLCMLFVAGCSYFRLPVLQGNIVDYEKAEQLELGMTPRQVEFLLGTPLIKDSFGSPRWDYVVYYRSPDAKVIQKNLSIYFESDAVSRIEGRDELLADWRKQKAAVKQVKEILETPHPGQLPANASGVRTEAQTSKPAPVEQAVEQPEPTPAPQQAPEPAAAEPETQPTPKPVTPPPAQQPANEPASEPAAEEPKPTPAQSSSQPPSPQSQSSPSDYPPDMTTIYKK